MASDELIWQILDKQFCSYKTDAINHQNFCKHPMNATGFCKMSHCPLANSQYATVVEKDGKMFLCIKTPERAHLPRKLWEKIPLPYNLDAAFAQIDKSLRFWDNRKLKRCKLRYHRLFLMLRRMRKLKQRVSAKMVPVKKKVERRLKSREQKAEKIAMLEHKIEAELLERLRKGVYPKELYQTQEETEKETEEQADNESIDDVVFEEDESEDEEEEEIEFDVDDLAEFDFSDAEEDIEDIYNELEEEYEEQPSQKQQQSSTKKDKMKSADSKKRLRSNDDDNDASSKPSSKSGAPSSSSSGAKRPRRRRHLEIEYEDSADRETLSS